MSDDDLMMTTNVADVVVTEKAPKKTKKKSVSSTNDGEQLLSSNVTQEPVNYNELPSNETAKTYDIVFVSHNVKNFCADTLLSSPFKLDDDCAMFVHTTWNRVQHCMNELAKLKFEHTVIWKIVELRGNTQQRSHSSGDNVAAPTTTFVLLGNRGLQMKVAHNHLPYKLSASVNDAERFLLDMAADLFVHNNRLCVAGESTTISRINKSAEYDTWVFDKGFLPHKPFTPKSARKCRIFAAWLQHSSFDVLKAAKPNLDIILNKQSTLDEKKLAVTTSFSFLPEPDDGEEFWIKITDIIRDERWQRRLNVRLSYLRHKSQQKRQQKIDGAIASMDGTASAVPPPAKRQKTKGFAAVRVVSQELADFIHKHFPDEPIEMCPVTNQPKLARTRVVQLINKYIDIHGLKNEQHKNMYEFWRNEEITNLLKPSNQTEDFLTMSRLLNPHFLSTKPAPTAAAATAPEALSSVHTVETDNDDNDVLMCPSPEI